MPRSLHGHEPFYLYTPVIIRNTALKAVIAQVCSCSGNRYNELTLPVSSGPGCRVTDAGAYDGNYNQFNDDRCKQLNLRSRFDDTTVSGGATEFLLLSPSLPHFQTKRFVDQPPLTRIIYTTRLKFFVGDGVMRGGLRRPGAPHLSQYDRCGGFALKIFLQYTNGAAWPLYRRTGSADQADRVTTADSLPVIVESDFATLNIGLANAYHPALNRQAWSTLVGKKQRKQHSMQQYDDWYTGS